MEPSTWQRSVPSTDQEWRVFLGQWAAALASAAVDDEPLAIPEGSWLGFPAAGEDDIATVEARLGVHLPPSSYRTFLCVTNGWHTGSSLPTQLLPIGKVNWLVNQHSEWVNEWVGSAETLGLGDDPEQPATYLPFTLQISDVDDNSVCLLNPRILGAAGEWEAWFFGNWIPGADIYPSFGALMVGLLESALYRQP